MMLCIMCLVFLSLLTWVGLASWKMVAPILWVLVLLALVMFTQMWLPPPDQESDVRSWEEWRAGWGEWRIAGAGWRVGTTFAVIWFGLPALLVTLATQGDSGSALTELFSRRPAGQSFLFVLGYFCLELVPGLIVIVPEYLRSRGRARNADSSVPGWLAGLAGAATVAFVLLLYFDGAVLAKTHIGVVSVAAFGVATLLAPFYKTVASTCLNSGIMNVFDPWQWWSKWCRAYGEMKGKAPDTPTHAEETRIAVQNGVDGTPESGLPNTPQSFSDTVRSTRLGPGSDAG